VNKWGIKFDLPEHLGDKAVQFGESSYGATLVTLVLRDGSRIEHVHVAGGRNVIKASDPQSEALLSELHPSDIVDVLSEV
jgi:hypothetical protein